MIPITNEFAAGMSDRDLDAAINLLAEEHLKPNQVIFAELFATGMTSRDAAKAAGYSSTGTLLKNERLLDLVVLLREQMSRASNTTRAWRKTALRDIHDKALDNDNYNAAISSIRELNSMDHEEHVRLTVEHGINQLLAKLAVPVGEELTLISKIHHIMQWSESEIVDALEAEFEEVEMLPVKQLGDQS